MAKDPLITRKSYRESKKKKKHKKEKQWNQVLKEYLLSEFSSTKKTKKQKLTQPDQTKTKYSTHDSKSHPITLKQQRIAPNEEEKKELTKATKVLTAREKIKKWQADFWTIQPHQRVDHFLVWGIGLLASGIVLLTLVTLFV